MNYGLRQVEERVYALLDENRAILEEKTAYGDPGASLSGLITALLPDAARIVLSTAARGEIDECRHMEDAGPTWVHMSETNIGSMQLPADFLRLLYFKMSDWSGGVVSTLAPGGEEQQLRHSCYGWRRRSRPAVCVTGAADRRKLEIYGSRQGATVESFEWLAVPQLTDGQIELPRSLFGKVCEKTAEMIKLILE